jgi:hypothetical protein
MHRTRNSRVGKDRTKTDGQQKEHRFVTAGVRTAAAANPFTLDNPVYPYDWEDLGTVFDVTYAVQ